VPPDLARCLLLNDLRRSPRATLLPPGRVRPEPSRCSISTSARASARCRRSRAPLQRPRLPAHAPASRRTCRSSFTRGLVVSLPVHAEPPVLRRTSSRVCAPSRHHLPRPRSGAARAAAQCHPNRLHPLAPVRLHVPAPAPAPSHAARLSVLLLPRAPSPALPRACAEPSSRCLR
jgi:hypothetical protein